MRHGFRAVLLVCLALLNERMLIAHGGGLDSNGGHHDRKNGGYHFHRAVVSEPVKEQPPMPALPAVAPSYADRARTNYRGAARTVARTEPAQSYRITASNDYSFQPHLTPPPAQPKIQLEPHFRAWLANGTTKDIVSYTEHDDRYMFALTYGGSIGFPKSVVTKIEQLPASPAAAAS